MSKEKDATFTLKAVINKQKTKVLFAEIDNEFANVLLGFITLPLGRIVQVLGKHYGEHAPVIGSLNTLYNGVSNLDHSHFKSYDDKLTLLNPKSAYLSPFRNMNLCFYGSDPTDYHLGKATTGSFVDCSASFIVSDELRMMDNVSRSFVESLECVGVAVADLNGAETRTLTFGVNEIMDLLKGLFISHHPLTDIILGTQSRQQMKSTPEIFESGTLSLYDLIELDANSDPKEMIVMFEKSSKKFLFAQADQDFVDILFSILVIPLAVVESLIQSDTGLKNVDNLHGSMHNMHFDIFTAEAENWVSGSINPLAQSFISQGVQRPMYVDSGPRMYAVSDDLTVTPFSACSTLSLLNQMKVSASDVQELELGLDLDEVIDSSFLEMSLTSTCAMTDGLKNVLLMRHMRKKPKH